MYIPRAETKLGKGEILAEGRASSCKKGTVSATVRG